MFVIRFNNNNIIIIVVLFGTFTTHIFSCCFWTHLVRKTFKSAQNTRHFYYIYVEQYHNSNIEHPLHPHSKNFITLRENCWSNNIIIFYLPAFLIISTVKPRVSHILNVTNNNINFIIVVIWLSIIDVDICHYYYTSKYRNG